MNQEKTGKFIAQLRKEKELTQIELANKLGITDRAISKWENGRGMPDLSLLAPLCEELDVSINELLSGEKLDEKKYQEKFEENIIKTIEYTDRKINKTKRIFLICISIILLLVILFTSMFCIDINRMRNNKPVVFSTWGFSYCPPVDLNEEKIEYVLLNYLIEKGDSEQNHHENEKTFASMRVYLIEEKDRNIKYDVYAWVVSEKYYLENGEIKEDSGYSIPYKFTVEKNDGSFMVTDLIIPRDGSLYSVDMKEIFPYSVRNDMNNVHTDGTVERLRLEIEAQTKLYFQN